MSGLVIFQKAKKCEKTGFILKFFCVALYCCKTANYVIFEIKKGNFKAKNRQKKFAELKNVKKKL